MKHHSRTLAFALAGSLLATGSVMAQNTDSAPLPPPPPPAAPLPPVPPGPPVPPPPGSPADAAPPAADANAPAPPPAPGAAPTQISVNSGQAKVATMGTPPEFATLAKHGAISASDASAYPALANDFEHADQNRDGKISKAEYARWTSGK